MSSPKLGEDCARLFANFISGVVEHFDRQFDCLFLLIDFTLLSRTLHSHKGIYRLTFLYVSVCVLGAKMYDVLSCAVKKGSIGSCTYAVEYFGPSCYM